MVRALIMVMTLSGCAAGVPRSARWPDHRKEHDAKLGQLENEIAALKQRIERLETEVRAPASIPPPHEP
jgi:hypothetical protein